MSQLPEIIRTIDRVSADVVAKAATFQAAILSDVAGRRGTMHGRVAPVHQNMKVAGPAFTVEVRPGDNLMIHAAVEQCQAGDILVVTTNSPNRDGLFGEPYPRGSGGPFLSGTGSQRCRQEARRAPSQNPRVAHGLRPPGKKRGGP